MVLRVRIQTFDRRSAKIAFVMAAKERMTARCLQHGTKEQRHSSFPEGAYPIREERRRANDRTRTIRALAAKAIRAAKACGRPGLDGRAFSHKSHDLQFLDPDDQPVLPHRLFQLTPEGAPPTSVERFGH